MEIIVISIFVFIFVIAFLFSKDAIIKRKFKQIPVSNIGDCIDNQTVKIIGKLQPIGNELTSPLSDRSCSLYHIVVEEYRSSGKSGHYVTIINDTQSLPFLIENNHSYALINPNPAQLLIEKDKNFTSGSFNDASPKLNNYIEQFIKASKGILGFNKGMRYHEGILESNETVAVLGRGKWMNREDLPGITSELFNDQSKIFVIEQFQDEKLYISDNLDVTIR